MFESLRAHAATAKPGGYEVGGAIVWDQDDVALEYRRLLNFGRKPGRFVPGAIPHLAKDERVSLFHTHPLAHPGWPSSADLLCLPPRLLWWPLAIWDSTQDRLGLFLVEDDRASWREVSYAVT